MKRTATANWKGSLQEGNGTLDVLSGAFAALPYTFKGRFVDESGQSGTNPEELIAAAHSGCFAMQFSAFLAANGTTAENLAESHSISRERQDEFALESHRRAEAAIAAGRFEDEIVPVEIKVKRDKVEFKQDEHVRPGASIDGFAKLKPVFKKDGTVTAGNASGMNDAGAAVVLMSEEKARELGAPVRATILSYAYCGVDPKTMGIGPVPAVRKAMERAGRSLDEVGVIELNEAFAAQALAVMQDLDLDPAKVNPNGGAIALGHPISATGAVITAKILSEMEREDHELGLVTLCIGGGQGIALLLGRG